MSLTGRRQVKPWTGVGIDRRHPLAQGLQLVFPFNEKVGVPYELISATAPSTFTAGSGSWASTVDGPGYHFYNTRLVFPCAALSPLPGITVLVRTTLDSLSSTNYLAVRSGSSGWQFITYTPGLQWYGTNSGTPRAQWSGLWSAIAAGTTHTYVVTDVAGGGGSAAMYFDGSPVTTTQNSVGSLLDASTSLSVGVNGAGSSYMKGNMSLLMIWNRVLSPTEVNAISENPWQVFQPAWPRGLYKSSVSFSITEYQLPTYRAGGSVAVHAVGVGTSWTTGTTFTVSGTSGWGLSSVSVTDGTHATLVLACPSSGGSAGTLVVSQGTLTANISIGTATLAVSPSSVVPGDSIPITLTGTFTVWSVENPVFTVSGSGNPAISSISITSNTSATATLFTGTTPGATLTITDPSTAATATVSVTNTVNTTWYVSKNGLLFALFANASNQPIAVTAISSNPTFSVNGSPITCLGPFWTFHSYYAPFVIYQPPSAILDTAVVTVAANSGWATTSAGAAAAYIKGVVGNYVGGFEPPQYGYVPFTHLPSAAPGDCQLGLVMPGNNAGIPVNVPANWIRRPNISPYGWTNVTAVDSNGHPTTSSGDAYAIIDDNSSGNYVDSMAFPGLQGTWVFIADETSPSSPMKAYATVNGNGYTITSGPTTASDANASAGTLVGSTQVGKTWSWTFARKASPTTMDLNFRLHVVTNSGSAGNWTLTNETVLAPNGDGGAPSLPYNRAATAIDPNFLNWFQLPGNKGPAILRFPNWYSSEVDPADPLTLNEFSWNVTRVFTPVSITTIRAYSLAVSPNVYVSSPYPGSTANTGVTPPSNVAYYYAPSAINWGNQNTTNPYSWFVAEFVTSAAHGLKSTQYVAFTGTLPTISVTNGSSNTINYTITGAGNGSPVWVTSATTFLVFFSSSSLTTQSGLVMNTVASEYDVPGGSPMYVAPIWVPHTGVPPAEVMAAAAGALPNCGLWVGFSAGYTDAAITSFIERVLQYLPAGRKFYPEYENEVWNADVVEPILTNYQLGGLAGLTGAWTGSIQNDWYLVRTSQIHQLAVNAFVAAGRAATDVVHLFGGFAAGSYFAGYMVNGANAYNTANPTTPIQIDAIGVAPYLDVPSSAYYGDWRHDPASQATVSVGGSGGSLATGTYYAAYTYVDSLTGLESAVGTSESAQFTIASSGQTATITFNDTPPSYAVTRNVYLTAKNGAAGSEVRYATGVSVSQSTYTCTAAVTGSALPPHDNRLPAFQWAAASIAASDSRSIANTTNNPGNPYAANPWNYGMWCDFLRHWVKYELYYGGPNGSITGNQNVLANYKLVNNQSAPYLVGYESCFETFIPVNVQDNPPNNPNLIGALTHDVFYYPEQYWVELAFYQFMTQVGLRISNTVSPAGTPYWSGSLLYWGMIAWAGQQAGRGDNSDGKGTNQFWLNTGTSQNLRNVSVRFQAWRDWAGAGTVAQPRAPKRWFPGLSSIRPSY